MIMLTATLPFTSCDNESSAPSIKPSQMTIEVASEGGAYSVEYTIVNPLVGGRLDAETECEWIEDLDATYEKIKFEVAPNYEEAIRMGEIELFYDGAAKVVLTVNQAAAKNESEGHKFVDLGLSVKWANFNVGAASPEDCGDYFAWGEIGTKSEYSLRTYLYWEDLNGNDYAYDMNDSNEWVVLGNDISGSELYDAATANWGDGWRMPTESEVIELCEECVWKSDTMQGVHGVTVIGPNGNSIFLPAAGCYNGKALNNRDKYGHYWCSTLDDDAVYSVHYLYFGSDYYECSWDTRFYGHSVRPVVD